MTKTKDSAHPLSFLPQLAASRDVHRDLLRHATDRMHEARDRFELYDLKVRAFESMRATIEVGDDYDQGKLDAEYDSLLEARDHYRRQTLAWLHEVNLLRARTSSSVTRRPLAWKLTRPYAILAAPHSEDAPSSDCWCGCPATAHHADGHDAGECSLCECMDYAPER